MPSLVVVVDVFHVVLMSTNNLCLSSWLTIRDFSPMFTIPFIPGLVALQLQSLVSVRIVSKGTEYLCPSEQGNCCPGR